MARFIITGEYKDKATKAARKDLKGFTKDTEIFAKYAKKYWGIATAAASYYAQKALRQSIKNALEDEKSQRVLALTLGNVANATDAAIASTEQQIAAMQMAYGVMDDQLRPALARLARSSGSASQAAYDLKLALDISAATGKSLEAVTAALGKALDGNYASLQRLGLGLDASLLKTKDQKKIFDQLRKTFASFAANEAATTEGKFRRIAVAADDAKEIIGVALIDSINQLIASQGGVDSLAKSFDNLALAIGDTIRGLTIVAEKIATVGKALRLDLLSGSRWLFWWLKPYQAIGKQQRINLAIQKSHTQQIISARNAEMTALKASKDVTNSLTDTQKKTVEQLMAEEAARKAGFKLTEDIDSIQTVAAAKRLEEGRQYKAQILDAAQAQFEAIKNNYDLLNSVWQTQLVAFDAFLNTLKAKSVNIPVNFIAGSMPAQGQSPSIAQVLPESGIPSFVTGGTGTAQAQSGNLALGGQTVVFNINAGAIGNEEFLVSEVGKAFTQYQRLGNVTAPAGFI